MIQEKLKSEYHKTKSTQAARHIHSIYIDNIPSCKKYSQHSNPFGTDKANKNSEQLLLA